MNQSDETFEEMQEDEVLFNKTDEYPLTVATTSIDLTQAIVDNISILNEKMEEA